jgi:hypothetical protein
LLILCSGPGFGVGDGAVSALGVAVGLVVATGLGVAAGRSTGAAVGFVVATGLGVAAGCSTRVAIGAIEAAAAPAAPSWAGIAVRVSTAVSLTVGVAEA